MRLVPRHWHDETWVCSLRGHVVPAARVQRLRPEDSLLGFDLPDGRRFGRCLRCDTWVEVGSASAGSAAGEVLAPLDQIAKPRRGRALQDAILTRVIAIERGIHSVAFTLLAAVLALIELRLPGIQHWATGLETAVAESGQSVQQSFVIRNLNKVVGLRTHGLVILLVVSAAYAVVEGVEAIGLWRERRWAEYLTVLATAGFLPLEIHELINRVTVLRIGALAANVAILLWLLWSKHLFGLRGGESTLGETVDWAAILAQPTPAGTVSRRRRSSPRPPRPHGDG